MFHEDCRFVHLHNGRHPGVNSRFSFGPGMRPHGSPSNDLRVRPPEWKCGSAKLRSHRRPLASKPTARLRRSTDPLLFQNGESRWKEEKLCHTAGGTQLTAMPTFRSTAILDNGTYTDRLYIKCWSPARTRRQKGILRSTPPRIGRDPEPAPTAQVSNGE